MSRAATPLADDLARHAAFLNRLARALSRGRDADDLVQDAYVAALSHPPDPDRPARPWLAQIVRNVMKMRLRGEARRREREAAWDAERPVPTPEELLERAHAHRALAEQVLLLEEPFRRTILFRFVEGLDTAHIAELEQVAPATVRWRIKEGLDRLRERMSAESRWMRALAPVGPGLAGLPHAHPTAWLTGALVMKMKSKIVVAILLLLAAGGAVAVAVRKGEEPPPAAASAPSEARPAPTRMSAAAQPGGARPRPPDVRPLALVAARADLDPDAARGSIEGRVMNWSTAQPVAGAEVVFSLAEGASTTTTTDASGAFRFEPDRAGRVAIAAITAPGYLPFAPEWGYSPIEVVARPGVRVRDLVVYLSPAIDYVGVVQAPDGTRVAGADVRIIDLPAREQELISIPDRFRSDAKGEFHFHAPDGALFEARARGYGPGRASLDGSVQNTHRLTLRLAADGSPADELGSARITGAVVDAAGAPMGGVLVSAAPDTPGRPPPRARFAHEPPPPAAGRAVTGPDGTFAIDGLDPGNYRVEARDDERSPARAAVTLAARATASVRLTMTSGARLVGHVRDAGGEPVPAFTVVVMEPVQLGNGPIVATRTFIDRDGAFAIDGLEAHDYKVQATAHGHAPAKAVDGAAVMPPARPAAVDIVLPVGGTLTGVVRTAGAKPLENARVTVESGAGDGATAMPFSASAVTGADGTFVLRGLAPGRRSVFVAAYRHHATILSGLEVQGGAQLGPIEVSLTPLAEGEEPTVELAGIGAALGAADDTLQVNQVLPGGGAAAAGLAVGDRIATIDGRTVVEIGFDDAIQAIRGPIGTRVRLGVRRAAAPTATVEIVVERMKIRY